MKAFSDYHPFVLMTYFLSVTIISMFSVHPIFIGVSLFGAFCLFSLLTSGKDVLSNIAFYIPMFILISVTNPLFSHNGETPLFFLNDNPITLEAILYGMAISVMLIAVMFWFKSYSEVMTSDKFIYLFGKIIPKLSVILSMALRFTPLYIKQIKRITRTQKTLGLYTSNSLTDRFLSSIRVFSSILTWSLENAVDTADSMKARGYGLKGRTHFSLFRFTKRDSYSLFFILISDLVILCGFMLREVYFSYYPTVTDIRFSVFAQTIYVFFAFLSLFPAIIEIKENLKWKYLISKI